MIFEAKRVHECACLNINIAQDKIHTRVRAHTHTHTNTHCLQRTPEYGAKLNTINQISTVFKHVGSAVVL